MHATDNVFCKKCNSNQIVAKDRGFSISNLFATLIGMWAIGLVLILINTLFYVSIGMSLLGWFLLFISFPSSLIGGYVGRSNIQNGCMSCGNKWIAGKI